MNLDSWHSRFIIQARWTSNIRKYLFDKAGINNSKRILEVGCGTGAVLNEINHLVNLHGLDIDPNRLFFAKNNNVKTNYLAGSALALPYKNNSFDIIYCHYLLLWLSDPIIALNEFIRVTENGGHVIVLAEPNYRDRVDEPEIFKDMGQLQTQSLIAQGANPYIGEKLLSIFNELKLVNIESGILDKDKPLKTHNENWESEWAILEYDLKDNISDIELAKLKIIDFEARKLGIRVNYIPTHFGIGEVNKKLHLLK